MRINCMSLLLFNVETIQVAGYDHSGQLVLESSNAMVVALAMQGHLPLSSQEKMI